MSLRVVVDGTPLLADEPARAFWARFSAWMEEHRGDLGGFARAEGLASVHPELHGGEPVLIASRTAGQAAYVAARMAGGRGAPTVAGTTARPARETPTKRRG